MDENPAELSWPELTRARRALVVVDVVESVRLMQAHEADVIDRWRRFVNEVQTQVLPQHGGRLVKSLGDGMLLEFESVPPAVAAALEVQRRIVPYNAGRDVDEAMHLRVAAHVADVVVDQLDVYGTGVNLAARLISLAEPGQIIVSAEFRDRLVDGLDAQIEDLGECYLKHISEAVRAYRLWQQNDVERRSSMSPEGAAACLRPALLVMPLRSAGASGDSSWLGNLIADELIVALSASESVDVISRLSAAALQGRQYSMADVRAVIGAHYVLSGTCLASGERVNIHVELAETRGGHIVWAEGLSTTVSALLAPDNEPTGRLAQRAMTVILSHELRRARNNPLPTLENYALLMHGITLMHHLTPRDFERSREVLLALIDRVPRHPEPRAWLAKWHVLRTQQGWTTDPHAEGRAAHDCTRRALDIDPEHALALTMDGLVNVQLLKRLEVGEQQYRRALECNPNESLAWLLKGTLHAFRGQGEEAVHDTERALGLSPLDPLRYLFDSLAASAAASAGHYERAVELARRSLRANSAHTSTLRTLAIAQSMLGRMDDARATVDKLLTLEPGFTVAGFRAKAPGAAFEIGQLFAEALKAAGVPE
jgi:adenylate cyclase